MRNKKNQNNMCDAKRDLQTLSLCKLSHFLRILSPLEVGAWSTLCTAVKHFIKRKALFSDSEALPTSIISRMRAAIAQRMSFAYVGPSDWNKPIRHLGFRYRFWPKYKVTST